ncbi:MAG TPA: VWA domain-containing protein, partial [Solirubrobacteraceae bacterium]
APAATVGDALRVAEVLAARLLAPSGPRGDDETDETILAESVPVPSRAPSEEVTEGEAPLLHGAEDGAYPEPGHEIGLAPPDAIPVEGRALSADELARLLAAGAEVTQGVGEGGGGEALVTDLAGKLPAEVGERAPGSDATPAPARTVRRARTDVGAFRYDEWDDVIGDYRTRWCTLYEHELAGDGGEFFAQALTDYAGLIPVVRREFQRIRPARYRIVRGLEDGEDFDLGAVVDARAEQRARRPFSDRLYRARRREERDVATLFLLDMSASTDEPVVPRAASRPARRIIDVTREALVVMAEALEELGDAYAIYGFSGQGRDNVEFFRVKSFGERLGAAVRARVGGVGPRGSTRMGTAVRHAVAKLGGVAAPAKHLLLLSDGFPQDLDYGEDRRSHAYGIRDTAVALREAERAGITPFCVTVDRAGHDYLREMCEASRYMVIEDITALPRELPKIYRRLVRA